MSKIINAQPNPEFLIKSISEQGYSLETALSDLIDNSITAKANKIEILTEKSESHVSMFITDNGIGMNYKELMANMQFPSNDMDKERDSNDLGRFGLGMKTASFSQTRKFTVVTKKKNETTYSGLTWDVNHLKKTSRWEILRNTEAEINSILHRYRSLSENHLEKFDHYSPSTIIIWEGLKNFDKINDNEIREKYLSEQLTENTYEHLGIVFHKFIESEELSLRIRMNNKLIKPFNPFISQNGEEARVLEHRDLPLGNDILKIQGYVLPVTAIDNPTVWSPSNKNLLDMEGLYIYRGNRIIYFGGWNKIIRKQKKLNLARLKVQVGNINDDALQLNVAKSKITIPHELKIGVLRYINSLKHEAEKEFNNRGLRKRGRNGVTEKFNLLSKKSTTKGPVYTVNEEYPVLQLFTEGMSPEKHKYFRIFIRKINSLINKRRFSDDSYSTVSVSEQEQSELVDTAIKLLETGLDKKMIYEMLISDINFDKELASDKLKKALKL